MTETFREQQDRIFRERVQQQAETTRKAAEYEQQQADAAELRRVEGQRQKLEQHLKERGTRYVDATGSQPSSATLATWRDEYASDRERQHQADRRQRYDQAAANDNIF